MRDKRVFKGTVSRGKGLGGGGGNHCRKRKNTDHEGGGPTKVLGGSLKERVAGRKTRDREKKLSGGSRGVTLGRNDGPNVWR